MKFTKRIYILILFLSVISACSELKLDQINTNIQEAELFLDVVKQTIKLGDSLYLPEIEKSEEKLNEARRLKRYDKKLAILSAEESIRLSEQALKKINSEKIKKNSERLKRYIQEKEEDSSLKDLLIKLNNILIYAQGLEDGIKAFSPVEATQKMEELAKVKETIKKHIFAKIESDVSFDIGKYTISKKEGKQVLDRIINDVLTKKMEFINKFPNSKVLITVKTVGYTDTQPLLKDKQLGRTCRGNGNQCLSELRAEAIGEYIAQGVSTSDSSVQINREAIGKGEELPVGVTEPYPASDPRRRICIVDIAISAE